MGKEKRPVLSISILASNRPDTIRRCLDSVKLLMEQIPSELILVDTSENSDIHKILLEYTKKVVTFHWCNDFAKARNAGLSEAKGEWFLFLDDDEWFEETEPLVDFFRSGEYRGYGCANYLVRNYFSVDYKEYMDSWASRLIQRFPDTHFESRIHEYLVPVRGECRNIPARVGHSGYVYRNEAEHEAHFRRNASLLREMIAAEPERMRWKVQLVQEYRSVRRYDELEALCLQYLEECRDVAEEEDMMDYGTLYVAATDSRNRTGRYQEALAMADRGLSDARMNESCRAYLYLYKGVAYERLMDWKRAEDSILRYMSLFAELKENPRKRERQKWALIVEEVFEPQNLRAAEDILKKCETKKNCVLTVSMLVSGREKTTERSLQSLLPLLSGIRSELILVDTGCSEALREKLKLYTQDIIPFTWCNDFAKARNAGLEKASGEWFLFLDDDEWFEDVTPVLEFFRSGEYRDYQQAVYKIRNYSDLEGTEYTDDWASRMIRRTEETRFEGRVHESLVPATGKCKRIEAFVHHFGYAFANEEEKQAHVRRNVTLLEALAEEEPDNMRWPLHLIKEYISCGMWEKLRDCSDTMLKRMAGYDEPFANQCRGAFYSAILYAETQLGDYGQVHAHFAEYIRDGKLNAIGKCSVYLRELEALYAEARKAESGGGGAADGAENASEYSAASVVECWRRIAEDTAAYLENWDAQSRWQLDEQQQTIQDSIVLVNHAVDDRSHIWVSNLRLLALHHTGSTGEEVQQGAQDAEGRLRSSMEGKGDFLWFDETYWELGKAGILAMEEILLSLSLAQWMALVYALKKIDSIKKWEEARRRVEEIRTQDDIRYSYFFMNYYNEAAAHLAGAQSLAQAETFLAEISGWNLNYAKRVYTDAAFEGEMEMLPDNCRAAVYLDRAMSCSGDAWNEKLENLRLAVNTWPRLAENVKNYAKLLGEERKRQEEEARRAQDELQQMKEGVLQQILILMQNGMGAQALAALGQLRGLLPADPELAELEEELKGKLAAE